MSAQNPRTVFATDIFIRELKRQWHRQNPAADPAECPVGILESYPPAQRAALVRAVEKAIEASTDMDEVYLAWIQSKTTAPNPA